MEIGSNERHGESACSEGDRQGGGELFPLVHLPESEPKLTGPSAEH